MPTSDRNATTDFDSILSAYGNLISKVCYFYASDTEDFNDLRQEALLNIWKGIDSFREQSKASTWIYRVTLNSCVSYFRKNKRRSIDTESIEAHPELLTDDSEKALMISDMYNLINRLDQFEKAIVLMWLDGNDYEEIAEVVGINRTTVGTRLHRIKEKLLKLSK